MKEGKRSLCSPMLYEWTWKYCSSLRLFSCCTDEMIMFNYLFFCIRFSLCFFGWNHWNTLWMFVVLWHFLCCLCCLWSEYEHFWLSNWVALAMLMIGPFRESDDDNEIYIYSLVTYKINIAGDLEKAIFFAYKRVENKFETVEWNPIVFL